MRSASFAHLAWEDVPAALAALHAETPVGSVLGVRLPRWAPGGVRVRVAVDGRVGSEGGGRVTPGRPADVINGAGFGATGAPIASGRAAAVGVSVMAQRLQTLPDVVGPGMRALICGLNPSLVSAEAGFGYAGVTNRFWPVALASGLVTVARRPLAALRHDGVGITDMVKRATARSHHLEAAEYHEGAERVERLVAWLEPAVVIFVGLEGWRAARDRRATPGWQAQRMADIPTYLMPSTSGANARTSPAQLVGHLQAALAGPC